MLTGIDVTGLNSVSRRAWLHGMGLGVAGVVTSVAVGPATAAAVRGNTSATLVQRFAACWDALPGTHRAGWLRVEGSHIQVQTSVELPTRGHGLDLLPDGSLLVAARRPGDWLLRVPPKGRPDWVWMEPGRVFSGHVRASADGQTVFTTEIDTDTGQGLLGVRDARSLEKTDEWPTHGLDPHAVSRMPANALGQGGLVHPLAGMLFVANGGIDTALETGRTKRHLDHMDSSLICLHPNGGEPLGQWRLHDPRLSLRHLAWASTPDGQPLLGVALQAEHGEADARAQAPLLAVLGWHATPAGLLHVATGQPPLAGYGGDIAVLPGPAVGNGAGSHAKGDGPRFVVSATRGHALAQYTPDGAYTDQLAWPEAGALSEGALVWAGGRDGAIRPFPATASRGHSAGFNRGRLDNHWLTD